MCIAIGLTRTASFHRSIPLTRYLSRQAAWSRFNTACTSKIVPCLQAGKSGSHCKYASTTYILYIPKCTARKEGQRRGPGKSGRPSSTRPIRSLRRRDNTASMHLPFPTPWVERLVTRCRRTDLPVGQVCQGLADKFYIAGALAPFLPRLLHQPHHAAILMTYRIPAPAVPAPQRRRRRRVA